MSYTTKEKARTSKDLKLGIDHLKKTIALDKQKANDHSEVKNKEGYDKEYNEAHEKDHKKDVKGAEKLLKKYKKRMMDKREDLRNSVHKYVSEKQNENN